MTLTTWRRRLADDWLTRGPIQIALLVLVLAAAFVILWHARARLDPEAFLVHGYLGVFVLNVLTAATILFPLPGEAANVAAGALMNPLAVAVIAASGATIGEMTSYLAGFYGRRLLPTRYEGHYARAARWMNRYGLFAVFLFSFVPMLVYDLIGIVAGSTRYHIGRFVAATFAGRLLRYLVYAYAGYGLAILFPIA